jgi:cell division protein FtsI/penicillin-binding protein 2
MMTKTVTKGTAKKAFYDPKGRSFLPGISVAGKTGTLSRHNPHRTYNWWVGYAPVDDPKIAVAALVVNEPQGRIKASYVAREALRNYLVR